MPTKIPTILTFGLISFPIKVVKATETPVEVKNLCVGSNGQPKHDPTPLQAPRKCPHCDEIKDGYVNIVKGIKAGSGYAIDDQGEVNQARTDYSELFKKKVEIVPHAAADFDKHTVASGSTYYVTPEASASEDHYKLLVALIEAHPELAFVTMHTLRSAASLWRVIARDGVLVMEQRQRGDAVKAAPSVGGTSNPALYAMLDGALSTFVQPYDPVNYEDQFSQAVEAIAAKATEVVSVGGPAKTAAPAPVVAVSDDDLMAKLAALSGAA